MKTRIFFAFLLVLTAVAGVALAGADTDVDPTPAEIAAPAEADAPAETGADTAAPAELPTLLPELTEANGGGCCEAKCFNEQTACLTACGGGDPVCSMGCRQQYQFCRSFC